MFRWFENLVTPYPEAAPVAPPKGFFAFLWACSAGLRPYIFGMMLCTAVKTMPSDRELEAMLRDEAGLSNRDAKAALSVFKKTLRDGGETEDASRDASAEAISRELDALLAAIRS